MKSVDPYLIFQAKKVPRKFQQWYHQIRAELVELIFRYLAQPHWLLKYFSTRAAVQESIALVRLDLIGDFIIWLDAAKEFKALYPNKKIVLYANSSWAELARGISYWDEVVVVDVSRLRSDKLYLLDCLIAIRRRGFKVAIQPTYSREYIGDILVYATFAEQRVGMLGDLNNISAEHKYMTDDWYTKLVSTSALPKSELNRNGELIRALGHQTFRSALPEIATPVANLSKFVLQGRYCVVVPGASWKPKTWPAAYFAQVALEIADRDDLKIVLCGTDAEYQLCEQVSLLTSVGAVNLAGKTNVCELVEIIRNAEILIANDSAAVHIATATNTSSICIMGGGHFGRFLPYAPEVDSPQRAQPLLAFQEMSCYGCGWRCGYISDEVPVVPCVSEINVSQVLSIYREQALKIRT